jgi:hypothetical protein
MMRVRPGKPDSLLFLTGPPPTKTDEWFRIPL